MLLYESRTNAQYVIFKIQGMNNKNPDHDVDSSGAQQLQWHERTVSLLWTVVEIYSHRRSADRRRPKNRQIPAFATLAKAGSHRDTTSENQIFPGMRGMAWTESRLFEQNLAVNNNDHYRWQTGTNRTLIGSHYIRHYGTFR